MCKQVEIWPEMCETDELIRRQAAAYRWIEKHYGKPDNQGHSPLEVVELAMRQDEPSPDWFGGV